MLEKWKVFFSLAEIFSAVEQVSDLPEDLKGADELAERPKQIQTPLIFPL